MIKLKNSFLTVLIITAIIITMSFGFFPVKAGVDTTAPNISIDDMTIRTYIGSIPELVCTAEDEVDGTVEASFTWSNNALDEFGGLKEGTHTCFISAEDLSKNKSTVTVTFIVTEDEIDISGYVFVTIICDGMDTVVKAYQQNSNIDMSAYLEKDGYIKSVKTTDGKTVTDFTAKEDMFLYVSYEKIQNQDNDQNIGNSNEKDSIDNNSSNDELLIILSVVSGVLTLGFIVSVVIIIIRRKNRGGKR